LENFLQIDKSKGQIRGLFAKQLNPEIVAKEVVYSSLVFFPVFLLSSALCPLPSVFYLPPSIFCLLTSVFCLLSSPPPHPLSGAK
jgi:hypothetical protein